MAGKTTSQRYDSASGAFRVTYVAGLRSSSSEDEGVLGLGSRVWGLGFRVWGLGFGVWV